MTKKVKCIITGDWQYCNEARYTELLAKYGGTEETLHATYTSRIGAKLLKEAGNDVTVARAKAIETLGAGKNKIQCIVTGEKMFISPERMEKLKGTMAADEAGVRAQYVSRVAARLRKEAATQHEKKFTELDEAVRNAIDDSLRERFESGDWPAPSAPKGSKQTAEPKEKKVRKAKAQQVPADTQTVTQTEVVAIDPLRMIEGETAQDRKNRIRREKNALAKAEKAQV